MQHQPPDDVAIQVNATAVAAVDERSSTNDDQELQVADGGAGDDKGLARRNFSQAYKMKHRKPLVYVRQYVIISDHAYEHDFSSIFL